MKEEDWSELFEHMRTVTQRRRLFFSVSPWSEFLVADSDYLQDQHPIIHPV
jgi:hypothetical protein